MNEKRIVSHKVCRENIDNKVQHPGRIQVEVARNLHKTVGCLVAGLSGRYLVLRIYCLGCVLRGANGAAELNGEFGVAFRLLAKKVDLRLSVTGVRKIDSVCLGGSTRDIAHMSRVRARTSFLVMPAESRSSPTSCNRA